MEKEINNSFIYSQKPFPNLIKDDFLGFDELKVVNSLVDQINNIINTIIFTKNRESGIPNKTAKVPNTHIKIREIIFARNGIPLPDKYPLIYTPNILLFISQLYSLLELLM